MRVPASVENQLRAQAAAADRANRPTMLVVVPALLLVGALLLTLVAGVRLVESKRTLERRLADRAQVERIVFEAEQLRRRTPDLDALYPPLPGLGDEIEREARRVWPEGSRGTVRVGQVNPRPWSVSSTGDLVQVSVDCTVSNVSFQDLTTWIRRVIDEPTRRRVFVSKLSVEPTPQGWTGTVQFRAYQKAR